ncbi:alpha-glucosidase, partial [Streptomyces sp. NPDC007861]
GLGAGSTVTWLDAPDGVLALARDGFLCTTNTTGAPVRLPAPGTLLLATGPVAVTDGVAVLPEDTTAWWTV